MQRRSFLQLGLGSLAFATLGAPLVARRVSAAASATTTAKARACILLYMQGGASQIDTFDPKPGRDTGGEFKAISTAVRGIQVSEHLPLLAKRMKQLALIRSLTSKEGNHDRARHLMHTSYPPQGGVDHPCIGSYVAADRTAAAQDLPGYVAIGGPGEDAGFLGPSLSPFVVQDATRPVRYLTHAKQIDEARFQDRVALWRGLEDEFAKSHPSPVASGQKDVGEQAIAMMASPKISAFDVGADDAKSKYGDGKFATGCLMARRLVEQGVPFVEVTLGGWDTHADNFSRVKDLSAQLDAGMSALLDDLHARGLLDSTLILWIGDFGRTPKINARGGRDHYPQCTSVVLAGGGVKGGQVIGATDADGAAIKDHPVSVPDLWRTLAVALGLDPDRTRYAPSGRPIKTVDGGTEIAGLF
jgi:hypothetical protein